MRQIKPLKKKRKKHTNLQVGDLKSDRDFCLDQQYRKNPHSNVEAIETLIDMVFKIDSFSCCAWAVFQEPLDPDINSTGIQKSRQDKMHPIKIGITCMYSYCYSNVVIVALNKFAVYIGVV